MSSTSTRERILEAADALFYTQGFGNTSFGDIADAVQLSRGNFYHHFRSKDDLLAAVIDVRLERTRALLAGWRESTDSPRERLHCFVTLLVANREPVMRSGCPVGTLCEELARMNHALLGRANEQFALYRGWLRQEFSAIGYTDDRADELALRLMSMLQGICRLANTLREEAFIGREVTQLERWIERTISSVSVDAEQVKTAATDYS